MISAGTIVWKRRPVVVVIALALLLIYLRRPIRRLFRRPPSLKFEGKQFRLGYSTIQIFSGSLHYFRVVPEYWQDRILRLKAAGLNTIDTYVPWNLHEPQPGFFDFSGRRNLREFLQLAKRLGMHVLLRPGPYICAEWENGGLPSWLLTDPNMVLRSMYPPFLRAVERYFDAIASIVEPEQYGNNGAVIAVQVENEYGVYGNDQVYMQFLKEALEERGIFEQLFTCENGRGIGRVVLPGALVTINFNKFVDKHIKQLLAVQPDRPVLVSEFWPGWYDSTYGKHHIVPIEVHRPLIEDIIDRGASINFYMFHGGTNFGFMNGGVDGRLHNWNYSSVTTSYDYDAPVSENGTLTRKWYKIRELLLGSAKFPPPPRPIPVTKYGKVKLTKHLLLDDIIELVPSPVRSNKPLPMENLPVNGGAGQSYGYLLYRHKSLPTMTKRLFVSQVHDFASVAVNGRFAFKVDRHYSPNATREIGDILGKDKTILDILVENCGRVNYGVQPLIDRKGILGGVYADGVELSDWIMYPLEFQEQFIARLQKHKKWKTSNVPKGVGVALFRGVLNVVGPPKDTFLEVRNGGKGIVIVNSEVVARFLDAGPQRTFYVPAPMLVSGPNLVLVFDINKRPSPLTVKFVDRINLGPIKLKDK